MAEALDNLITLASVKVGGYVRADGTKVTARLLRQEVVTWRL